MSDLIRNFVDDFDRIALSEANKPLFLDSQRKISYAEFHELVERCLTLLRTKNIPPGGVILSLMPNAIDTLVIFFASMKGGYTFAPLHCTASTRELENWVKLTSPVIIFTTHLISTDIRDSLQTFNLATVWVDVKKNFDWLPAKQAHHSSSQTTAKLYLSTSGTTGEPKAIVIDANKLWSSGCAFAQSLPLQETELRFWNFLSMAYLGGLFNLALIPVAMKASVVIDDTFTGSTFFGFWQTIDRFDINTLWLVPAVIRGVLAISERMEDAERISYSAKIKYCFLGTAPIDLKTKQRFQEVFGITPLENFALSETTFISAESLANTEARCEGSVGNILPYVDIKFVEPVEQDAESAGKEIWIKTPFLFLGYLKQNGITELLVDSEGFFATGDLGTKQNGALVINGRVKDIIKKSGFFIALREVELVAEQYPDVAEAAAVKTSHDFYGESYYLYVRSDKPLPNEDTINSFSIWLHNNLVKYKWPEKIIWVEDFPRTSSGKVRKHLLLRPAG